MTVSLEPPGGPAESTSPAEPEAIPMVDQGFGWRARAGEMLSFRNMSAVYIGVGLFVVFSIWVPDTFLQTNTWRQLIDSMSITALLAMGLVFPVAAGQLDLSIGTQLGFGAIVVAKLVSEGTAVPLAVAVTIVLGCAVGILAGVLVTEFGVNSVIATLGVSSVLLAAISWLSSDQQILNLGSHFQSIGLSDFAGLTSTTWIMLGVGLVLWYVLEHTAAGRQIYAVGGNIDAARLAGVRTSRVVLAAFGVSGTVAALAGVVSSSRLATGDPSIGPPYLLPAFTAVFLGSTQFRNGRFNIAGTVVAGLVLAMGVKGFQLAGAPTWIPNLFNGLALLLAVGIAAGRSSHAHAVATRLVTLLRGSRTPTAEPVGHTRKGHQR